MVNMLLVAKKGFGLGISALLVYKFKEYITEKPILNPVVSEALSVNLLLPESLSVKKSLPSRIELLSLMKSGTEYDILVIGGGATGCGVALDACTRGFFFIYRLYVYIKYIYILFYILFYIFYICLH
ncbi:uncharacterized protein LOC136093992 [Hydra vulgaris]|uniref:uncharacterized protein LOC136093992 n=1 Tax=Hydra vulgaris TaxID=6087 RepID=UPI0032E9C3A6